MIDKFIADIRKVLKQIKKSGDDQLLSLVKYHLDAKDRTEYAANVYWVYACSLLQKGQASEAEECFYRCYVIRREIYGERHWLTALARRNKAAIDYTDRKNVQSREYLMSFVQSIEDKQFTGMYGYEAVWAETIWSLLQGEFKDVSALPEYEKLLDTYERLCNDYPEIESEIVSKRLAWNFRGNYYMQKGEYILAENAFKNALKEKGNGSVRPILSDDQIKSNLMIVASLQNDSAVSLSDLSALSDEFAELSFKDSLRMYIMILDNYMQSDMDVSEEEIQEIKELAFKMCESVIKREKLPDASQEMIAMFIYAAAAFFLQDYLADEDEQRMYLKALKCVEEDDVTYRLSGAQRQLVLQAEASLAWNLGLFEAEALIRRALNEALGAGVPLIIKAGTYQMAAAYFGKCKKDSLALDCAKKAMGYLTEIWHGYVKYANDIKLANILMPIQLKFVGCYAVVRRFVSAESAYERVLQFKALASLAGRERNRILHAAQIDPKWVQNIRALQDQIAELEAEALFNERFAECEALEKELREEEYTFAREFPAAAEFKEISWPLVQEAIPDHCAVLEYYSALDVFGLTQFEPCPKEEDLEIIELFFIKKQNGKTNLRRFIIKNAKSVREMAEQFIGIYQEKSSNAGVCADEDALEDLRYDLYEALIKPVIHELDDVETIYFAPDSTLINLPFELLYEDDRLEEHHQIVKIECARDFLFTSSDVSSGACSDKEPGKGSLVIGNPEYYVKEINPLEETRAIGIDLMEIAPLPFAEMEAHRVAAYLSAFPCTGRAATKDVLLSAKGYENLHIATHGFFDLSSETDAIYSSCLMFAGVNNQEKNAAAYRNFGNGIVTADEISRLDLKTTKLVVLSSCLNGRSDMIISKGFQGMVGAFAAAGVKYVIAYLWNAPETLGTVIFMDKFYYYYTEEKMNPPMALAKAKDDLRTLTVSEMREQGWFNYVQSSSFGFDIKESMKELENADGRLRPYKDEVFWGGFSCYRCN